MDNTAILIASPPNNTGNCPIVSGQAPVLVLNPIHFQLRFSEIAYCNLLNLKLDKLCGNQKDYVFLVLKKIVIFFDCEICV